ncbi:hypothetical protein RF55_19692 [Lasius niger]|uniref:Uncharacterized protein n=1 Tax=Lasius niger TaxID=67767 RepID=A0A0J7MSP8_LASNI|nr:hypothetical protein RF55_19692 [Lasius niger]
MSIMNEFIMKQKSLLHSIARSQKNFEDIGEANYTSAKIRSRMSVLKETWSQCIEMHTTLQKVVAEDKREDLHYFKTNQFDDHEAIYLKTLDIMADCLEKTEPKTTSNQPAPVELMKKC